jgi:hypothetical protein
VLKLLPHNRLLIEWEHDFAIASPVRRCNQSTFQLLLAELQESWQRNIENASFWQRQGILLGDRITSLLPRVDVPVQGFSCAGFPQEDLESLFIGTVKEGVEPKIEPCYLVRLHTFNIKAPPPPKKEGGNITPADVPIPSSGNDDADLFARLITVDNSIEGAWMLWSQFDAGFLSNLVQQFNELQRDPDERVREYIAARFADWKQQNQDVYKKSLGLI